MLSEKQWGVAKGMSLAGLFSFCLFLLAYFIFSNDLSYADAEKFALVSKWLLLPAITLFGGIAFIARHRFLHVNVIDGENDDADQVLTNARAYLQNTLEQIVLLAFVLFAFVQVAPDGWLNLVPVLCCSFVLCRLLFALGYQHGAPARAFGFAGTFYPTVLTLLLALWFWVVG